MTAYSNYATALAGHIVARVSGVPFEQYIHDHILEPLGMSSSTFQQPLPAEVAGQMSEGYRYLGGRYEARWFEVVQASPAGALSATGDDMARFMVALLQGGSLDGAAILRPDTLQDMMALHFSVPPQEQGWGRGFAVQKVSGLHIAGHGGDTTYFHSFLSLLPQHNVGIYISTNTDTGGAVAAPVVNAFLERYFLPVPARQPQPESYPLTNGERFAGDYLPARANFSTMEKFISLFQAVTVIVTDRDTIRLAGPFSRDVVEWAQVEPLVFGPVDTDVRLAGPLVFQDDAAGRITHLHVGGWTFVRPPWYGSMGFTYLLLGVCLPILLLTMLMWPIGFFGNWSRRRKLESSAGTGALPTVARVVAWAYALLTVLILAGIASLIGDLEAVSFGLPPFLMTLLRLLYVTTALATVMAFFAAVAWWKGWWTRVGRLHYTFVTMAAVLLVWWQWYWRLLA